MRPKDRLLNRQCSAPLCGPSCEEKSPHKQVFIKILGSRSNWYPFPGVFGVVKIWCGGEVVKGRPAFMAPHPSSFPPPLHQ